jgi:hypothetical protein
MLIQHHIKHVLMHQMTLNNLAKLRSPDVSVEHCCDMSKLSLKTKCDPLSLFKEFKYLSKNAVKENQVILLLTTIGKHGNTD